MKSFDDAYNEAVDYSIEGAVPAGVPVGVAKLSHVLRAFNAMMGGGLGFAMEVIEPAEFELAVAGFRYLDLLAVADLLADLVESHGTSDYDDSKEVGLEEMLNEGDLVLDAFRRKVAVVPSEFGF
ncbi:hypothetical protein [Dactylosporangium sp. CS-033363]|uniref:hypothetical protein n=1 Tax=Dactylosporangium sp. CS-033363 TaxID=3239935 RepID=UPI003D9492A3